MSARQRHARIDHIIDAAQVRADLGAAFEAEGENGAKRAKALLKAVWEEGHAAAKQTLASGEHGHKAARQLAAVADEVVTALYACVTAHLFRPRNSGERFAILAVGGYGRGELAPYSDLDLLFLRNGKPTPFTDDVTKFMLLLFWDMQLKVGHASRNIEESLRLARDDHTIRTAMLEARYIAGDEALAADLLKRFRKSVVEKDHAGFIAAKLKERDERHAKAGASRYMVEPNLKEGKGGLRDLHSLFWMARHQYGFDHIKHYVEAGVFTPQERNAFRRALLFFWTVRCHVHFIVGRAEERLTFDLQPELAKRMGYGKRAGQRPVERFMKRYFIAAKQVGTLTRVLCAKLEADQAKRAPRGLARLLPLGAAKTEKVEAGFELEAGRLTIASPDVFDEPANLIRLFEIADKRNLDVHPAALGEAARRVRTLTPAWRKNPAARAAFLEVVTSKRHPGAALRLMNEAGVLGRFVPEFGRIVAQMQFNMYHHYTVDEHTLYALDAMAEIEEGRHKAQHPLSTEIFSKIVNRRSLYLAMLLHDTGKGDGDQSIEGEKNARAACERLGLPKDEVDLVGWLVRHHLVMSDVAQKRDIGDPRTVAQFAQLVGDVERLRLLLVLTVSDIRAVGPSVWNDWKGQLLRDLYRLTEAALVGGRADEVSVREHLAELAAQAKQELALSKGDVRGLAAWLEAPEDSYWINHDAEALAWHAQEVLAARDGRAIPHVVTRIRPVQAVTEVLIYAGDRPGLFASLAAAISSAGADIASARVHTTKDGAAFDVFSIQTTDRRPFGGDDPSALESLVARLTRAALEDHPAPAPRPPSGRAAAFLLEPWARVDNLLTPDATVVETMGRDRPGLLAGLAHVFADARISIASAHIETMGERASDVFYVQEEGGGQVDNAERAEALKAALEAVLRAAEPETALAVARASSAR